MGVEHTHIAFLQRERRYPKRLHSSCENTWLAWCSSPNREFDSTVKPLLWDCVWPLRWKTWQIDDWRDIALPKDLTRGARVRSLGANSSVTGFGTEYDALASVQTPGSSAGEALGKRSAGKHQTSHWWNEEDGLFNTDDEGRAEKQLSAIAASNIIRNFSFMPDNENVMAQHRHCLETVFQCIQDHMTGKEDYTLCVLNSSHSLLGLNCLSFLCSWYVYWEVCDLEIRFANRGWRAGHELARDNRELSAFDGSSNLQLA